LPKSGNPGPDCAAAVAGINASAATAVAAASLARYMPSPPNRSMGTSGPNTLELDRPTKPNSQETTDAKAGNEVCLSDYFRRPTNLADPV
jgi:hypothetical protein